MGSIDHTPGIVKLHDSIKPPVADDFMYDFKYNHPLPTTDVLGVDIPADCNAQLEAEGIVGELSTAMETGDALAFADLFLEYGVWRDKLSFTWDFRTFNWRPAILKAATDLFRRSRARNFGILPPLPKVSRPYPDFSQLQFVVSFETDVVTASAIVNAVLTKDAGWKIYTMHTVAEGLLQFPEAKPADGHMTGLISWEAQRALEVDSCDPEVLIIGGGQNGLAMGARLKALGMENLIIEKSDEVGDIWKNRYEYLSLHFPHWPDALPYFPYPKGWPTYTPAQKQAQYMQWYASAMELNVWTKSSVVDAKQDKEERWTVTINKQGKETRTLRPRHLIMATSLCGLPKLPSIPGMPSSPSSSSKITIRHSSSHTTSRGFKNVCVVGTSSSAFDTAYECSRLGIPVTILQRSPTYVMSLTHSVPRLLGLYAPSSSPSCSSSDIEQHDRIFFSTPTGPGEELARRTARDLERLDADLLESLNASGLRTWRGQRGTGNATLGQTRNGGFYFDAGACREIVEGRIKVEQGEIERFKTDDDGKGKVVLSGGRERDFDLVVFATGFGNMVESIRETLGEDVAGGLEGNEIWGVDEEGEAKMAFRETGVKNLWLMVGFLPLTRYASKLLALRLKALKEGVAGPAYKE